MHKEHKHEAVCQVSFLCYYVPVPPPQTVSTPLPSRQTPKAVCFCFGQNHSFDRINVKWSESLSSTHQCSRTT